MRKGKGIRSSKRRAFTINSNNKKKYLKVKGSLKRSRTFRPAKLSANELILLIEEGERVKS